MVSMSFNYYGVSNQFLNSSVGGEDAGPKGTAVDSHVIIGSFDICVDPWLCYSDKGLTSYNNLVCFRSLLCLSRFGLICIW